MHKMWAETATNRLDGNIIRKFDRIRAHFRGYMQRKNMAELQRMHIAAQKIQLSWACLWARRIAGVQTLIRFYRAKRLKVIQRQLRADTNHIKAYHKDQDKITMSRPNPRAADGNGVFVLHFPGYIRRDQKSSVGAEICRVATAWCGLQYVGSGGVAVRIKRMDYSEDTTILSLEVPRTELNE